LRRVMPFHRVTEMHIYLGYVVCVIIFGATLVFFLFFGILCQDQKDGREPLGDEDGDGKFERTFCRKFFSEIMLTGYAILLCILLVALTSFFRERIPYWIFYAAHHLVFLMFAVTVLHTNDHRQRDGSESRSQTFKWFSMPLILYAFDRAYVHFLQKYEVPVVEATAVGHGKEYSARYIVLRVKRPPAFIFLPGNHAFLRFGEDQSWHPFSIGSDPQSETLDFFMQVYKRKSWTAKLWDEVNRANASGTTLNVAVMGPFGTTLGRFTEYSHFIMCSTGTGIVPMLSHLKAHMRNISCLEPQTYHQMRVLKREQRYIHQVNRLYHSKTLLAWLLSVPVRLRYRFFDSKARKAFEKYKRMDPMEIDQHAMAARTLQSYVRMVALRRFGKKAAILKALRKRQNAASRRNVLGCLFCLLPIFVIAVMSITVSWENMTRTEHSYVSTEMKEMAFALNVAVFALFCFLTLLRPARGYYTFLDVVIAGLACFTFSSWNGGINDDDGTDEDDNGQFGQVVYLLIMFYVTSRMWYSAVDDGQQYASTPATETSSTLDGFTLVWSTRSAALVQSILPVLNAAFEELCEKWGAADITDVLKISIHCTDEDEIAVSKLVETSKGTALGSSGALKLNRPNFETVLSDHMRQVKFPEVLDGLPIRSSTLVGFCGGPAVGHGVQMAVEKIRVLNGTQLPDQSYHNFSFAEENFGHAPPPRRG